MDVGIALWTVATVAGGCGTAAHWWRTRTRPPARIAAARSHVRRVPPTLTERVATPQRSQALDAICSTGYDPLHELAGGSHLEATQARIAAERAAREARMVGEIEAYLAHPSHARRQGGRR